MGLLTPLALAFAALSLPILALYMLKLRRRDVEVSSTLLWQRLLRDRQANAPWQRLRRNLLLILQLVILALLTLALARPFVVKSTVVQGSAVILLDASASMQARDVEPSRFAAAVDAAREVIAGLDSDDEATIIAVGPQPRVLGSATGDRAALRQALSKARPTQGPADWEAAFTLVGAGLAGLDQAQTVLISDGALPPTLPPLPGELRLITVGRGSQNVAITALATRESEAGVEAFARVANYGDSAVRPLIEFSADGTPFDARRLEVPARGTADVTLTDLPYDARILQARMAPADALGLDDTAWTVRVPAASGRVLLVSEGNLFLERALGSLAGIDLTRLAPGQPLPDESYDLTIYDRVVTGTLPTGNLWLIAPRKSVDTAGGLSIRVGGVFTDTAIARVAEDDPLLRYVDLSAVRILQARAVEPPPGARTIVEARGGPLIFVAERPDGRLALMTFDLHQSDLPLHVAFPILVANLTDWLLPQGGPRLPTSVQPGAVVPIGLAPGADEIRVLGPDGETHPIPIEREGQIPVFGQTETLGPYGVVQYDQSGELVGSGTFAVNLFDGGESDIAPRQSVVVGESEVTETARREQGQLELWPWLIVLALAVFAVEWWIYWRGAAV